MQLTLPFVTNGLALRTTPRPDKHYAIMDSDWFTAEFMPCLISLVGVLQTTLHAVVTLQAANESIILVYPGATWPLINTRNRFQA
ncbi:unnamed protein product [Penicillium camemberti]|uniref:Str. FM013 n=1 Tax=Penicillium camemberti (strain FM 013) TaxID=1429867 RepID=A0A0G4PEC6_PENC3|nr:unnamed protein product [Penicillium camemberti]